MKPQRTAVSQRAFSSSSRYDSIPTGPPVVGGGASLEQAGATSEIAAVRKRAAPKRGAKVEVRTGFFIVAADCNGPGPRRADGFWPLRPRRPRFLRAAPGARR